MIWGIIQLKEWKGVLKEIEDAFEYGGYAFAKEALNLIDNLERSKLVLQSDEALKDTEALKKTLEHLDIINKDLISIFTKNNKLGKPYFSDNKKINKIILEVFKVKSSNFFLSISDEKDYSIAFTIIQKK